MLAAACASLSANAEQPRRIFLIEGLAPWQPGGTASLEAFRQRLKEKSSANYEIYLDFLELGRFPGKAHEERMVRLLGEKFAEKPPHLLVPNGPGSLRLLVRHRDTIAPGVPIVFCCATADAVDPLDLPRDVVGVITEYNWAETLALAARLQPDVRNLVLISGASELDKVWRERALGNLAPHLQGYRVQSLFDMTYDDLLKEVARLSRDTIVLQISVFADASGRRFFLPDAAAGIAAASAAPLYAPVSTLLGRGIVGGYIDSFEAQGRAAADIALEILAGKDPATLPPRTKPPHTYAVDANALKRWNMTDAELPPGATVLFREPTVWDQHRAQAIGALAIVLLQAALIAWLLFERYRRRRAAEQAGKARAETGQYRENLAHLVRVHTVGEMSTAIAHEVNQPLVAIKNYALAARRRLAGGNAADAARVEELLDKIGTQASRAGDVLQSLRSMVKKHQSEPARVEVGRLVEDTLKLVEMESRIADIRLESAIAPDLPPVYVDGIQIQQVVMNLARNAIEAMEEAGQAGGAITVGVQGNGNGEVAVSVADHGPGIAPGDAEHIFDPFYSTKGAGLGVGLSISRAIVEAHGGRLSLTPNAGGGCIFRFTLPVANEGH
jgi:signal transduction histidine kinase/ABC-type uncharacterized transport system substrate-binding protein